MTKLGLPCSPWSSITTEACRAYPADPRFPSRANTEVSCACAAPKTRWVATWATLRPARLRVRERWRAVPCHMEPSWNIGLNDESVPRPAAAVVRLADLLLVSSRSSQYTHNRVFAGKTVSISMATFLLRRSSTTSQGVWRSGLAITELNAGRDSAPCRNSSGIVKEQTGRLPLLQDPHPDDYGDQPCSAPE